MINIKKFLRKRILNNLFHYQWQLIFNLGTKKLKSYDEFKSIVPPKDKFWADPFIIFKNNIYYVFFEEFIYKKNKAHISFLTINQDGIYSKPIKVLERPYTNQKNISDFQLPNPLENGKYQTFCGT